MQLPHIFALATELCKLYLKCFYVTQSNGSLYKGALIALNKVNMYQVKHHILIKKNKVNLAIIVISNNTPWYIKSD